MDVIGEVAGRAGDLDVEAVRRAAAGSVAQLRNAMAEDVIVARRGTERDAEECGLPVR